jgi:hypothetical protein
VQFVVLVHSHFLFPNTSTSVSLFLFVYSCSKLRTLAFWVDSLRAPHSCKTFVRPFYCHFLALRITKLCVVFPLFLPTQKECR